MKKKSIILIVVLFGLATLIILVRHFTTLRYQKFVNEDRVSAICAISDYLRDSEVTSHEDLNGSPLASIIWDKASQSKGLFLLHDKQYGILDQFMEPIAFYRFGKHECKGDSDPEVFKLSRRYQVIVWSKGSNKINEYGRGDDIFSGYTWEGFWEPDPTALTAFLRSRLTSRKEFR